jgi:hypothetical protein
MANVAHSRFIWRALAPSLFVVAFWLPTTAHADAFGEFLGARSVAMGGAHRGVGTSNETLILNPAGMAVTRRYSIDALYGYGGDDHINHGNLSAVDSKSSAVAAGVNYTRDWGNPSGTDASFNRVYFGLAYAVSPMLSVGFNAQNLRGGFSEAGKRRDISLYNSTAGISLNLGQSLGLGVAYQNLMPSDVPKLMPPNIAFGASLRTERVTVAGDMRIDMRSEVGSRTTFGAGAEVFLRQAMALRAGFRRAAPQEDTTQGASNFLAGGLGIISPTGGLQVTFEHVLSGPAWSLIGGMQFFM